MTRSKLRSALVAVISVAILNTGGIQAAQAGIVDTGAMVQTARDTNLTVIQTQLARDEVRAQLDSYGVDADAIDARLATLSDREIASLAKRMQDAPAGGDGLIVVVGLVFVVLLILELVGVIDIFKRA
jgi:hypothetical protein